MKESGILEVAKVSALSIPYTMDILVNLVLIFLVDSQVNALFFPLFISTPQHQALGRGFLLLIF